MEMPRAKLYKQYVFAGIVIGCLQILDGFSFAMGWNSQLNTAYSWLEMLWFLFSVVVLFFLLRDNLPIRAPLVYVSYIIINVALATLDFEPSDTPPGYIIPSWFTLVTIGCAILFLYYAIDLYKKILRKG